MYLDWLNEKRFSNSRAFFCPFHIFISFYLEVCKWSRFTLFILCIFFFMKIRVCLNKCKHQFQQVSALFCCPSERYKTIIYHYCPFPSQTWYNTVFLPFYIWVIENHPGRFLSSVVVTEFVKLLAQLIFVPMTWVLCWDASVCPPYSSLHRARLRAAALSGYTSGLSCLLASGWAGWWGTLSADQGKAGGRG